MPLLDLLGSTTMDVHDAIFDFGMEDDVYLFEESDVEDLPTSAPPMSVTAPAIQASRSHDSLHPRALSPLRSGGMGTDTLDQVPRTRATSMSLSPRKRASRSRPRSVVSPTPGSPSGSPLRRPAGLPTSVPPSAAEVPGPRSPLGALFGRQRERVVSIAGVEGSVRRMEALVEEVKQIPVNRLKDEMKELQVRGFPSGLWDYAVLMV